jgi:hypothetical protein
MVFVYPRSQSDRAALASNCHPSHFTSCSQLIVRNLVLPRWLLTTLLLAGGKRCTRLHLLEKQGGWQQTQKITEVTEFRVEVVSSKVARQQSHTLENKFISMSNQDKKEGLNWWMSLFVIPCLQSVKYEI